MSEASFLQRHRKKILAGVVAGAALYGADQLSSVKKAEHGDVQIPTHLPGMSDTEKAHHRAPQSDVPSQEEVDPAVQQYADEELEGYAREKEFNTVVHWANEIGSMLGPDFVVGIGIGEHGSAIELRDRDGNSYGDIRVRYDMHMSPTLTWDPPTDLLAGTPGAYAPYFPFLLDGQINPDAVFDSVSFVDAFRTPIVESSDAGEEVDDQDLPEGVSLVPPTQEGDNEEGVPRDTASGVPQDTGAE